MTSLHAILDHFRQQAESTRDLGDQFERLIAAYLRADPEYQNQYSDIWLWRDWPGRWGNVDTGIDLVAKEWTTGNYCAIQCKFYRPDHTLQKSDIDSFFTESGKKFATPNGEKRFSQRLIVSTTDNWSQHAEAALKNQQIPVTRLRVQDLENSPVDWSQFDWTQFRFTQPSPLKPKKALRPHQQKAIAKVESGFQQSNRGKLIMACGTGKTFTALKLAEKFARTRHLVLCLVPSIALLSQTLREWTAEAERRLFCIAVCSDSKASQTKEEEDLSTRDLAFPATTDFQVLVQQFEKIQQFSLAEPPLIVIFSTYQSLEVVATAQKCGLPDFDLVICDEAHRTTGVTLSGNDESHFVKIHQADYIVAHKRLYMTATPRIFTDTAKIKAQETEAELCSMDDENLYGREFYRLGFSEAVSQGLLSDYKVMVLAVDERYISKAFQTQLADDNNEIKLDDAVKIVGCWNGLAKRTLDNLGGDPAPMRRAVAFCGRIKDSEKIAKLFAKITEEYIQQHPDEDLVHCEVQHVDGKMNILKRNQALEWLKANPVGNRCHILSNARCLSEGVDVPALDAVMFLNPRNSIVDVVQSVGRVMRRAEGKKYGYVILPIGVPAHLSPEEALNDNKKYKVVWQVLQALRAHDDRFNAEINKIDLNQEYSKVIQIVGIGTPTGVKEDRGDYHVGHPQATLSLPFIEEWRNAIYAKIVTKCGSRLYWEEWAKDIATIAENHIMRIQQLLENSAHQGVFEQFLKSLQNNLNPAVTADEVVEMLAQHLITKPVFDALFEDYQFTQHNPVSIAMQRMLDILEEQTRGEDVEKLEKFYESVRQRARGIDNAAGKQRIIIELYDKFFKTAFPRMAERLGIVYTPVEVVDFIVQRVEMALRQEFGVGLTDKGVHILDPFTGTGTFIVRLLQSGLIAAGDLARKYRQELHANEIVLLAYYIAAVNIEAAYHGLQGGDLEEGKGQPLLTPLLDEEGKGQPPLTPLLDKEGKGVVYPDRLCSSTYVPFPGIVLTDTFQLGEKRDWVDEQVLPKNHERVERQKQQDIQVIMGNPPYSAGQGSENDNNQNLKYTALDARIAETYAQHSTATNKNSLYDSYIRAIRWASDRIKDKGIIGYVTNGSFIDSNAMDGLRKCLIDEFSAIYCFNLRGNQRTSGETSRQEGGKIFDSGSRATIAITLLIKNPQQQGNCQLFYHDIGDYLTRQQKLDKIREFAHLQNIPWQRLTPNASHDWINQRNTEFASFLAMGDKKEATEKTIFDNYSRGVETTRDAWTYNFSQNDLNHNISRMIAFYNSQVSDYQKLPNDKHPEVDNFIDTDPTKISWSSSLKNFLERGLIINYRENACVRSMYRPFQKEWLYFDGHLNHRVGQMPKIFPNETVENVVICVTGIGVTKDFNAFMTNCLPDVQLQANGQCFPLYTYGKPITDGLFAAATGEYVRTDNITNAALADFQKTYGNSLTKEDLFYYVYGLLHSPDYKTRFAADLKKMLPRIPFVKDFHAFSTAGRQLAQWHLNYETVEPYPLQETTQNLALEPKTFYRVQKMQFAKNGKTADKTTLIYNSNLTLTGIPLETYDYIVNGKSALDWIIERYQITTDKDSGLKNDPNDWSDNPRYIIDLIKRIVRVSVETVKIVKTLPEI